MQAPEELLSEMTPIQFSFAQSNCPHFTPTSKPSPEKSREVLFWHGRHCIPPPMSRGATSVTPRIYVGAA